MITNGIVLVVGITLALTFIAELSIVVWHRRRHKAYTFESGLDHMSKLSGPVSLLVAALALIYTYKTQQAADATNAEINKRAAQDAQEQRKLLQDTVGVLRRVSEDLKLNANASIEAAGSLKSQRDEQIRQLGMKPNIKMLLSVLNPSAGEGSVVGVIDHQVTKGHPTVVIGKGDKVLLLKVDVLNVGSANLQTGSINFETTSLDGGPSPVVLLDQVAGLKLPQNLEGTEEDIEEPFTTALGLPLLNLPRTSLGAEKLVRIRLSLSSLADFPERRFRLYISFVGDAEARRGIFDFVVKRRAELDPEFSQGEKALQEARFAEAFDIFNRLTNAGDPNATEPLGFMYDQGLGVIPNCARAVQLYKAATRNGIQVAMSNLGYLYETGHCVRQDFAKARKLYEQAATAGGSDGMSNLGYLYQMGLGVKPDYEQALEWYSKAAMLGNGRAMGNIGYMYETGQGVPTSLSQAKYWYEKAAEHGHAWSMNRLGQMYQNRKGVPQDYDKARYYYEMAVPLRNTDAANNLGFIYQYELGVKQDLDKARSLYEKAASDGSAAAKNNLGFLYQYGLGIPIDYKHAILLYRQAIALGNAEAMNNLGVMCERGEGTGQSYSEALSWYRKGAAAGDAKAMSNIARLYASGIGTSRANYPKARRWYERARAAGDESAEQELQRLPK